MFIPDYNYPVENGDVSAAVVYRLTDSTGCIWRSAPKLLVSGLRADNSQTGLGNGNAAGQWLVIPTLRHLMEGTAAQIEVYVGSVDLQQFFVLENDPTVDYIEFTPNTCHVGGYEDNIVMPTIDQAVAARPVGEVLYTTGGALPNDPPPQMECCAGWRNRVFGCFGNQIWPSQEFAAGLGLQWSSLLRVEWADGTGDILGICPIDWNYLAVFKRDAIGILSGPGPDGLGHGNYVVQTLSTKAGCTNPRSLVHGAEGCYYQDAATGRMMLLSPDLQVRECMPGAFDAFALPVLAALHVESKRQIWVFVKDTILVLDYKHRAPSAPLGQVYTWPIDGIGNATGAAIAGGKPVLMMSDGATAEQVANQFHDLASDGETKTAVLRLIETGEISPFGLQRMFNVSRVAVLSEWLAAHEMTMYVLPQYGSAGAGHTMALAEGAAQFVLRPESCMRIQACRIKLVEGTYTPADGEPVYGAGSRFVGFALELQDHGKMQTMPVGRLL
jgi:hypothetical protein